MKQKRHTKLATIYAILGFVLVIVILISQLATKLDTEIQSPKIIAPSDSTDVNTDTLDYNWEDIGY